MRLSQLTARNFRSLGETEINFAADLTVFVGENNSGKSNAIDAIRLLTTPLSGRRELYAEPTDVRFGSNQSTFEIEAVFADLTPAQQGRFLSAASDTSLQSTVFGLTYSATDDVYANRPLLWCGGTRGTPEPGSHEMIRHVYLPPLRDAKRELSSGSPTRIYGLLKHFLEDDTPESLAQRLQRSADDPVIRRIDSAVATGLSALTAGVRPQKAALGFPANEKLIDIARDLRFRLSDDGIDPEDLSYSGHGLANLLYIAAIAVELEQAHNADLTLFLVEEPEAHLHPQLQASVLGFLEDQAQKSASSADSPAGDLQVIVATHSPNLTAWVDTKKVVYFRSKRDPLGEKTQEQESPAPDAIRPNTKCVAVSRLGIDESDIRKINRYLDVTRSSLLYGGRVALVEGIAEAIIVPSLARHILFRENPDQLRTFRSAVFVPIDGVDFAPYINLLLRNSNGARIADRLVVITDGDATTESGDSASPGQQRIEKFNSLARYLGAADVFRGFCSTYSLEAELYMAGNDGLVRDTFLDLHPRSAATFDAATDKKGLELANGIQSLFVRSRKGDFAQVLADRIRQGSSLRVPSYLRDAIEELVK